MRACIPRFLFSRDAHMHPSVITRIIPGEFLRGFSCTAFASIRGYKPAVPLFPPPPSPRRNTSKERVISDKLAVLCAKRLVNGKNTPYDNFVWKFRKNSSPLVLRFLDYLDNSVQFVPGILRILISPILRVVPFEFSLITIYFWILYFLIRCSYRNPRPNNRQRIPGNRSFPVFWIFYFIITKFSATMEIIGNEFREYLREIFFFFLRKIFMWERQTLKL